MRFKSNHLFHPLGTVTDLSEALSMSHSNIYRRLYVMFKNKKKQLSF
jgi:hypothetical protein